MRLSLHNCLAAVAIASLIIPSGCSKTQNRPADPTHRGMMDGVPGQGPMGPMMDGGPAAYKSEGERIYFTATTNSGKKITFTKGPDWLRTKGGSCVSCHGPQGKGGKVPEVKAYAPDIHYSALKSAGYTQDTVERAITKGLDESGKPLSTVMPRWNMTQQQVNEVAAYLKTLGSTSSSAEAGKAVFQNNCASCHGADGERIAGWKANVRKMSLAQIEERIEKGGGGMPAFSGVLSGQDIESVAKYAQQLAAE